MFKKIVFFQALDKRAYLFTYDSFQMVQSEEDARKYLGILDDIDESAWNDGSFVTEVGPELLYTGSFLFVDQTSAKLTIGKILARLLKKAFTEKETETFWVDLQNEDMHCYDPCPPEPYNCCSIFLPQTTTTTSPSVITKNSEPIQYSIKKFTWHTWFNRLGFNFQDNKFTLVQNYTYESNENLNCGALAITEDKGNLDFFRENCRAKLRPLCMRDTNIQITDTRKRKNKERKNKERKKTRISKKKKKGSSKRKGRQLTETGRPVEMCATVLPALLGN